jgi:hypothetical protein
MKLRFALFAVVAWNVLLGLPLVLSSREVFGIVAILATLLFALISLAVRQSDRCITAIFQIKDSSDIPRIRSSLLFLGAFLLVFPPMAFVLFLMEH